MEFAPVIKIEKIDEEIERKLDPNYVHEQPPEDDKKNVEPLKIRTSNEILAELFSVFNASPPKELLNDENLIEISKKRKKEKKSKKKKRKREKEKHSKEGTEDFDEEVSQKKRKRSKSKDLDKDTSKDKKAKKKKRSKSREQSPSKKRKKEKHSKESSKDKLDSSETKINPERLKVKEEHKTKKRLEDDEITRSIKKTEALSDVSFSDEETYLKERKSYSSYRPSRYSYERERSSTSHRDRDRASVRSRSRNRKYSPPRRAYDRDRRPRSRSRSNNNLGIDKKRLLEIARKNAIAMFKNGSLPGCSGMTDEIKDKVLLKMRYGGKSVQDLTDFCRKLTSGNNLENLSDFSSDGDSDHDRDGNVKAFHHPFAIKEREPIVLNIKNSIPIPTKSGDKTKTQAIQMFPVSSGQDHRRTEQWVPVSPKREVAPKTPLPVVPVKHSIPVAKNAFDKPLPQETMQEPAFKLPGKEEEKKEEELPVKEPTPPKEPVPTVFPKATNLNVDVSSIISMRLTAMRRLQDNPMDSEAIKMIYNCQQDMSSWVNSKNTPGKFTGTTGVSVLSARQLSGDYDIWAKKDQLKNTVPVSGGMGMHLLQKMGWKPGEGLGRDKNGQIQPLLLDIKMDKKGLAAEYAEPKPKNSFFAKKKKGKAAVPLEGTYNAQQMQDKHPVSLLNELAAKRKWAQPTYEPVNITGPGHQKSFLFNVQLNGQTYVSKRAASTKKDAKMHSAKYCLQQIGVLPVEP